jgi:hypothetical protein
MKKARKDIMLLLLGAGLAIAGFLGVVGISQRNAVPLCVEKQECGAAPSAFRIDPERARRFASVFRS